MLFIKYVKFPNRRFDYKYLKNILFEKQDLINPEIVESLLEIYNEHKKYDSNYLQILAFLKEKISNFSLTNFDATKFNFDENFSEYDIIYNVLRNGDREIFKIQLNQHLLKEDSSPNDYAYYLAFENEIFDENSDVFKLYISKIKEYLKKRENTDNLDGYNDYMILNFFYLIYKKKINKKHISRITVKNNYFKFLLNLSKFPAELFNPLWLKHDYSDVYLSEFKNISYIPTILKEYLKYNEDEELMKIYFKI